MSIVASKGVTPAPSAIEDVRKEDETKERIEKTGERESGMVRGLRDERIEFGNGLGFKVIVRNIVAYLNAFIVSCFTQPGSTILYEVIWTWARFEPTC